MEQFIAVGYTEKEIEALQGEMNIEGNIAALENIEDIPNVFSEEYGINENTVATFTYWGSDESDEGEIRTTFDKVTNLPDSIKIPLKNTDDKIYLDMVAGHIDGSKILFKYEKIEDTEKIYRTKMFYAMNSPKMGIEDKISNKSISWNYLAENAIRSSVENIAQIITDLADKDRTDYCILDIGCGGGGLAIALASSGLDVYGCDPAPSINFAYLKRDVAMHADSVEQYADVLSDKVPEAISGNTIYDEAKAIKNMPITKTPLFFQACFEDIRPHIGEDVPIPDMITVTYVLKYIKKENISGFLEDTASSLEPKGKILIVDDEIAVDDEMLPSGLGICKKGEFVNNNGLTDRYFILEKRIDV